MERIALQWPLPVCSICRVTWHCSRAAKTSFGGRGCQLVQTRNVSNRQSALVPPHPILARSKRHAHVNNGTIDKQELDQMRVVANAILQHPSIPTEKETFGSLKDIEQATRRILDIQEPDPQTPGKSENSTPAAALLSLDSDSVKPKQRTPTTRPSEKIVDHLSTLAYNVVRHERVFITPKILALYVVIQSLLQRPATIPDIFDLYSHKPIASVSSQSEVINYKASSPNAIAAAIPPQLANLALKTAISKRDQHSALSIISTTYRTTAFQRNKIFRQAFPPFVGACLAPVATYTLASNLSAMQTALPPEDFTTFAFAGFITYVAAVSSIGYIALTTRNDQMERVTWVVGMPLWERWVREEERAACEMVAKAWGFREKSRWGEEEGEEWEGLKEWLGIRGMVLDKVALMEGME